MEKATYPRSYCESERLAGENCGENENVPTVDMIDGQFFIAWPTHNTMKAYDNIAAKVGVKSSILGSESIVSMLPERQFNSQGKRLKLTNKISTCPGDNSNTNNNTSTTSTSVGTVKQRSHQKIGQSVSDNEIKATCTNISGTSKYAQPKTQQQQQQQTKQQNNLVLSFNGSKVTRSSSISSSSASSNSSNNVCKESIDTNYCEQKSKSKQSSNNYKTLPSSHHHHHHHHSKKARLTGHKHSIGSKSILPPLTPMKLPTKRSIDCDPRIIDSVPELKVVSTKHPNAHKYGMKIVKIIKDPSLTLDWDQLQLLYDDMVLLSKPPLIGEYPSPMLPPYPDIISSELAELCVTSLEPTFTPQPVKRFQVTDDDDSDVESSLYDDWDLLALHDPSAINMEFSMR